MRYDVNGCEPDSNEHRARTHGYLDCVVAVTMRADLDRKDATIWRNYSLPWLWMPETLPKDCLK